MGSQDLADIRHEKAAYREAPAPAATLSSQENQSQDRVVRVDGRAGRWASDHTADLPHEPAWKCSVAGHPFMQINTFPVAEGHLNLVFSYLNQERPSCQFCDLKQMQQRL